MDRNQKIVRTSIIGILANVFLAGFKAFVGILSNSIAVVLDAVNNLSDAMSSLITIIGTKLASRKPDRKHPYGYGRIEYVSASIISMIVLYAGITSFVESVKKIFTPDTPDYQASSLIIIAVAVVVKILLGRYVKKVGEEVNSDSLINSGEDATLDSIISASTLVAAGIYLYAHVSLEAYLGAIISVVIIKSGIEMISDTMSRILGERIEGSLSKEIKATICESENALGAYDLILHDYGPDRYMGSVHVEVPDYLRAEELDEMTRDIEERVYEKHHVVLTAVGFYSHNTKNDETAIIRETVRDIVMSYDHVLQMHGFFVDKEKKQMRFDVVIGYGPFEREVLFNEIMENVRDKFPKYNVVAALDSDTSD